MSGQEATEERIIRGVLRLSRAIRNTSRKGSLSDGAFSLLSALKRNGPIGVVDLAQAEGLKPQSLSRLLSDLEVGGLIERSRDSVDWRRQVIVPTQKGERALEFETKLRSQWLNEIISSQLTIEEGKVLAAAAELMIKIT